MHARQQHFLVALGVVAFALTANTYADFRLFLRNPAELEEIAKQALDALFPGYAPSMDAPEFVLSERRAVLRNLVFREKGDNGRTLFRVATVEAEFSFVPPALRRITVIEPDGTIRIGKDGSINFDTGGEVDAAPPTLYADLHVRVEGGHLRVKNERDGTDLLVTDVNAEVDVTRALEVSGHGKARVGALYDPKDPLAEGAREDAVGAPSDLRFRPLFPLVGYDLGLDINGRLRAEVRLQGGECSPQLKSMIPEPFRSAIWDELAPSGAVDARLRLGLDEQGLRVASTILPLGTAIRPRGFPRDITDIRGRFEVVVALPRGATRPELIQVGWESVTAHVGTGNVRSRGSAFPGAPGEHLTLMVYVDAYDIPLDEDLDRALPADIREVYRQFDPQGSIQRAHVLIFKGPWAEEPQLSIHIDELAGSISAMYRDFPLRLQEVRGQFDIREDANVQIKASGKFLRGGDAAVEAQVVKGDLMDITIRARGLPVGPELVACLSEGVRARVEPFHLDGGHADIDVRIEKPRKDALPQPTIAVGLREVGMAHAEFAYPVTVNGRLEVVPRFPATSRAGDDSDPERVEVDLDLQGYGPGVVGAVVSGAIALSPQGSFQGRLSGRAQAVTLDAGLRRALPGGLREAFDRLAPRGKARDLELVVESPERFTARGVGSPAGGDDELVVTPTAFAYPVHVDAFDVARVDDVVRLRALRGRTPRGGRWTGSGLVTLSDDDLPPVVDLGVEARGVRVEPALIDAIPPGAALELLRGMRPTGLADASLRIHVPTSGEPRVLGLLDLQEATVHVDQVDPSLVGLAGEPVTELSGRLRLAIPDGVTIDRLEGRLAGARVQASGSVSATSSALAPSDVAAPGSAGVAAPSSGTAGVDLTVQLDGLVLDPRTRAMAGPLAADTLARFRPSGPVDLRAHVVRDGAGARVNLVVRPKGMTVVPDLFPMQVEELTGELEIDDGEPVRIDVAGRVGSGRLRVKRAREAEGRFPGAGSRGRVLDIQLERFVRPVDPRDRAALERELPDKLLSLFTTFNPTGPVDVHAYVYQPLDARAAVRWVAELRLGDPGPRPLARDARPPDEFSFSAGLRFEAIRGLVRLSGTIPELARGSCEGELALDEMEWKRQTVKNLRGRFKLDDGVLNVGLRGSPLTGELYGGRLKVLVEYAVQTQRYRGWVGVDSGRMGQALRELTRLREKPDPEADRELPNSGTLDLQLTFNGGGKSLSGRELPLDGTGWLHIVGANLLPRLDVAGAIARLVGGGQGPEEIHADFKLRPDMADLERVELGTAGGATLYGSGGSLDFDGNLDLTLLMFDTGNDLLQSLFENLVGVHLVGKLWSPTPLPIPFATFIDRLRQAVMPGGPKKPEKPERPAPDSPPGGAAPEPPR